MIKKKPALLCSAITLAFAPIHFTHAYEAGDFVVRVGATMVAPDESSDSVMVDALGGDTGMSVSVDDNTQLGLTLSYFISPRWAIELLAATPFEHTVSLENSALGLGDGALADIKHLPPAVSLVFYLTDSNSSFQPYIGAGVNYTVFFDEEFNAGRETQGFSDLTLDESAGLAAQIGFDYLFNDNWLLNASVRYIDIATTAEFDVGGNPGSVDVDINPWVYTLAVGFKF